MTKTYEVYNGNEDVIEEYEVDYMVLFGAYNNEHPEDHYNNRKSKHEVYETLDEAKEKAEGHTNARIWEIAHDIECGDIVFVKEVSK